MFHTEKVVKYNDKITTYIYICANLLKSDRMDHLVFIKPNLPIY